MLFQGAEETEIVVAEVLDAPESTVPESSI
jgi:hypothetical protein